MPATLAAGLGAQQARRGTRRITVAARFEALVIVASTFVKHTIAAIVPASNRPFSAFVYGQKYN